jgi:hypothetical protein
MFAKWRELSQGSGNFVNVCRWFRVLQRFTLTVQGILVKRSEVLKFDTASEAHRIANNTVYAKAPVRFGNHKFDLHGLSELEFGWNVDRHALFRQIVALPLQHASFLPYESEQLNWKIDPEALRAPHASRVGSDRCRHPARSLCNCRKTHKCRE